MLNQITLPYKAAGIARSCYHARSQEFEQNSVRRQLHPILPLTSILRAIQENIKSWEVVPLQGLIVKTLKSLLKYIFPPN